jgi:hypothetical protein
LHNGMYNYLPGFMQKKAQPFKIGLPFKCNLLV